MKKLSLAAVIVACGGAATQTTARVEPSASASASASVTASTSVARPAPNERRVVFGPDAAGPFSTTAHALATPVGSRGIVQLASTIGRMCILRASGDVTCMDSGSAWKAVAGISDATYLSIANSLACAVRKSGEVSCWGTVNESWGFHRTPTNVAQMNAMTRVSAQDASACALGANGHVSCVGMDSGIGAGKLIASDRSLAPVEPVGLVDVVDLFGSRFETCARERAGAVKCWGVAEGGVFGTQETTPDGPLELAGLRGATHMAFEQRFACAVLSDGGVACWGDHPALNDDDPRGRSGFQRIWGIHDATAVATGVGTVCVLRTTGNVVCIGANNEGELGDGGDRPRWGATSDTVIPVYPEDVSTGSGTGRQPPPRLRKRAAGPRSTRLMNVVGLSDAVAIGTDGNANCALRRTGALKCWGPHRPAPP